MRNLGNKSPEDNRKIFAHKDFKSTQCPGKHVDKILDKIEFTKP